MCGVYESVEVYVQDKTIVKYWRDVKLNHEWMGVNLSKCKCNGVIYDCLVVEDGVLLFSGWCVNSGSIRHVKLEDLDNWEIQTLNTFNKFGFNEYSFNITTVES